MEECNSNKKINILIVFDDIIADILCKKINPIVPEIFIRGRKAVFLLLLSHNCTSLCWKMFEYIKPTIFYKNSK